MDFSTLLDVRDEFYERRPKWAKLFKKFDGWEEISDKIFIPDCCPNKKDIFRAFTIIKSPKKVKMLWVGQDPYQSYKKNPENKEENMIADGLLFSTRIKGYIPPSLRNVFKELERTQRIRRTKANLTDLAKQGILMINHALTVQTENSGSHGAYWASFSSFLMKQIEENFDPITIVVFGKSALAPVVFPSKKHNIITVGHPSPLNTYSPFYGCDLFRKLEHLNILWGGILIKDEISILLEEDPTELKEENPTKSEEKEIIDLSSIIVEKKKKIKKEILKKKKEKKKPKVMEFEKKEKPEKKEKKEKKEKPEKKEKKEKKEKPEKKEKKEKKEKPEKKEKRKNKKKSSDK
jgi:uracil-DNA glycosylase